METKKTVSLEINGKTYDFRFYEETRCGDPEKTVCEQFCPLCSICDKTPDPRHYIDPKKYDGLSFNDFCLDPYNQVYDIDSSVILTLCKHAGEIVSKDQLLEYLNSEDSIGRCIRLNLIKETSDGNFQIIDNFIEWSKKEHLLDKEDRKFIHSDAIIGDDGFLGDLIPFQEDVEKYIKEVVECNGD